MYYLYWSWLNRPLISERNQTFQTVRADSTARARTELTFPDLLLQTHGHRTIDGRTRIHEQRKQSQQHLEVMKNSAKES